MSKKKLEEKTTKLLPKKKVDGKDKGDRYERIVAKYLQDWSGIELKRSPGSGSWSKKLNCDIVQPQNHSEEKFIFSPECKWNDSFNFNQLFKNPKTGLFFSWWEQTLRECSEDKVPMLFFRVSRVGDFVVLNLDFFRTKEEFNYLSLMSLVKDFVKISQYSNKENKKDIIVTNWLDFKLIPYTEIKEFYTNVID